MSVSDPLIKHVKGCILAFLEEIKVNRSITDANSILLLFCQSLEQIFTCGLITTHKFGFAKQNDPWTWLEEIAHDRHAADLVFGYASCVDTVKTCRNVFTNIGRFRLLVRLCLTRKCLHVPVEYLKTSGKLNLTYRETSPIGDEILHEIFLSVLRQCAKIPFELNTSASSFLDASWIIPEVVRLEFVPCDALGMTVSFAGDKAVIVSIKSNSVLAENEKVEVGDVLDSLNGVVICSATKGRLGSIMKSSKGRPIALTVVKAVCSGTKQMYVPIVGVLKQVQLDLDVVRARITQNDGVNSEQTTDERSNRSASSGYKATYMGYVGVGAKGDVKQIDKAVKVLLAPGVSQICDETVKFEHVKKSVLLEIEELGVRCVDGGSSEVVLKHLFMEISSCGSVLALPNYFAYIAGDKYCNLANEFTCYIFFTKSADTAYTVLQSIGQGFHRTHFAV